MLSKYTPKKISRHVYFGDLKDAPKNFPYFEIEENSIYAFLTIPGFKLMRDFDKAKNHIPNLAKAAYELIKQGHAIGYNDEYGTGKVYLQNRNFRNREGKFKLVECYFHSCEVKSNPNLESAIKSILKVLTNESEDLENNMILLNANAVLDAGSCCDEYRL